MHDHRIGAFEQAEQPLGPEQRREVVKRSMLVGGVVQRQRRPDEIEAAELSQVAVQIERQQLHAAGDVVSRSAIGGACQHDRRSVYADHRCAVERRGKPGVATPGPSRGPRAVERRHAPRRAARRRARTAWSVRPAARLALCLEDSSHPIILEYRVG